MCHEFHNQWLFVKIFYPWRIQSPAKIVLICIVAIRYLLCDGWGEINIIFLWMFRIIVTAKNNTLVFVLGGNVHVLLSTGVFNLKCSHSGYQRNTQYLRFISSCMFRYLPRSNWMLTCYIFFVSLSCGLQV